MSNPQVLNEIINLREDIRRKPNMDIRKKRVFHKVSKRLSRNFIQLSKWTERVDKDMIKLYRLVH